MENGATILKNSLKYLEKKHILENSLAVPQESTKLAEAHQFYSGVYPKEISKHIHTKTCVQMFTATYHL